MWRVTVQQEPLSATLKLRLVESLACLRNLKPET
jgi:hypothetical protein